MFDSEIIVSSDFVFGKSLKPKMVETYFLSSDDWFYLTILFIYDCTISSGTMTSIYIDT